ncbi:MAG: carbamoyltransferase HypF [Chloroflexota bacterium]|nr:carbamoyltransferase HypF [Chloroflexota bacterium]
MPSVSYHIHINGIVQGVGFRPFIYNLARDQNLKGWVRNSASGVIIEVSGSSKKIEKFISEIPISAPPLAQIDSIHSEKIESRSFSDFKIITSKDQATDFIPVSPDVATCCQCKAELFNPQDRRYRYPFINCTNCGPRFTIIRDIPYDRPKTTMSGFKMCGDCKEEYQNPLDRRFHAQPVACPVCGPHVWLELTPGEVAAEKEGAIQIARQVLAEGKILAIKGLGGFHLACDASNPTAVARLRRRKRRPAKPFALMAFNTAEVQNHVFTSKASEDLLKSHQAPIVLMSKKGSSNIAGAVAPGQSRLGFMLPYTPLHLLLLEPENDFPTALVMTSGNLSEEPIIRENQVAKDRLNRIADAYLLHDRPIHMRIDDSVFTIINEKPYPIRRARGFAPNPIRVAQDLPQVLAVGPQMKNTFCLTRNKYAFLSHYIGEMENWETYQDFQKAIQHYQSLFRIHPKAIGYDLHPDYLSTKYALERIQTDHLPGYPIQHHHAHLAAGMIENGLKPETQVAGLIFDGTGYGLDGAIWGGEVLTGNCFDFERAFHLKYIPLPGGDLAILKPSRMALSTLWAYGFEWNEDLDPFKFMSDIEINALKNQLEKQINTPMTSSMGRLFDVVASLLDLRQAITYEAQAAIELEALADGNALGYYPWDIYGDEINVKTTIKAILSDIASEIDKSIIAARFHNTIAQLSLALCERIKQETGIDQIVLSGGVWQNQLLLKKTISLLEQNNFQALIHKQTPPNDGCVAFGQALITSYRYLCEVK